MTALKDRKARCLIGFDGYADEIFRVVKERTPGMDPVFYDDMAEFGKKVMEAAGRNTELELVRQDVRFGGNGPLMAGYMADLGCQVTCVGLFEEARGIFRTLQEKCCCVSIGETNTCSALEFHNGKVMFGNLYGSGLTWEELKRRAGLKRLIGTVRECDLVGITNWSAFRYMNDILTGLKTEVFPYGVSGKEEDICEGRRKILFFDLSDLSAKSQEECVVLAGLLRRFKGCFQVVLSLNKNECCLLAEKLLGRKEGCENAGRLVQDYLGIHMTVLHTREKSCCFTEGEMVEEKTDVIVKPVTSTGAGDHFNGAFCEALLMGKNAKAALKRGNAAASWYMKKGRGPGLHELALFDE